MPYKTVLRQREGDGLTPQQDAVLDAIRDSVAKRGYPPTLREIAATLGFGSTSTVRYHMRALEAGGHIRRDPRVGRGIQVLTPSTSA